MKIGIAGIGGVGSNVARHLAQAGVGAVKIVDFDRVDVSNLNRQFYGISQAGERKTDSLEKNLKEIFPGMIVEKIHQRIGPENVRDLFFDCPVVVEGLDDRHLKKMILEKLGRTGQIIVSASGIAGNDMDGLKVKKMGNCCIVGDFISDQADYPLFPPKVAVVTAMMSAIVLQHAEELENGCIPHTG